MTHPHAKSAGWPEVREMESNLEFIYVRDDGSERNAVRQRMNWWPRHKKTSPGFRQLEQGMVRAGLEESQAQ